MFHLQKTIFPNLYTFVLQFLFFSFCYIIKERGSVEQEEPNMNIVKPQT